MTARPAQPARRGTTVAPAANSLRKDAASPSRRIRTWPPNRRRAPAVLDFDALPPELLNGVMHRLTFDDLACLALTHASFALKVAAHMATPSSWSRFASVLSAVEAAVDEDNRQPHVAQAHAARHRLMLTQLHAIGNPGSLASTLGRWDREATHFYPRMLIGSARDGTAVECGLLPSAKFHLREQAKRLLTACCARLAPHECTDLVARAAAAASTTWMAMSATGCCEEAALDWAIHVSAAIGSSLHRRDWSLEHALAVSRVCPVRPACSRVLFQEILCAPIRFSAAQLREAVHTWADDEWAAALLAETRSSSATRNAARLARRLRVLPPT